MRVLILFLTAVISLVSHAQSDITLKEWQHQVEQSDFSGIVLTAHNGEEIFKQAFGIANRELNIPFSEHTVFDIGSITKQFTAAAIVKLAEEGKLSLQDSLSNFFDDVPSDKQKITLHNMLTHSAGFPHGFGLYNVVKQEHFIQEAMGTELLFSPGDKYHYSNVGYSLLAVVIEKVTGMGWENYINQNLLKPAGLHNTSYRILERSPKSLAINYGRDPNAFQRFFSLTAASKPVGHSLQHQYNEPGPRWYMEGAGGFLSTIGDMNQWYLALRSGSVLDERSWKAIFKPYIAENESATSYYGYGWALDKNKGGHKRIFHDGSNGYSYAVFKYLPDDDVFIFIATNNRDDMPSELFSKLEHIVLDTVANKSIQPTANTSAD
ncbi:serine hydrolase domain-containing protein [Kangiella sp. M94]